MCDFVNALACMSTTYFIFSGHKSNASVISQFLNQPLRSCIQISTRDDVYGILWLIACNALVWQTVCWHAFDFSRMSIGPSRAITLSQEA